ncbi:MAG: peptide chain release factor N(5)-glutamine methyltransferase [Gammaproteobacteria bacterium]
MSRCEPAKSERLLTAKPAFTAFVSARTLLREGWRELGPGTRLDVDLLLRHTLGIARAELYKKPELPVSAEQQACFRDLLRQRHLGVPVAYLTQHKEFWSLDLEVNPWVLIPRPETEHLLQAALDVLAQTRLRDVADLGTGSGAIALAIAKELPLCCITATDISAQALKLARRNSHRLGLDNVEFREGDWWLALQPQTCGMVVSNPPYVAEQDPCLDQGDTRFEPRLALAGGKEGLACIAAIIAGASRYLRPGGWLLLEHGYDQKQAVRTLIVENGLLALGSRRDYQGHDRVMIAMRPPCLDS